MNSFLTCHMAFPESPNQILSQQYYWLLFEKIRKVYLYFISLCQLCPNIFVSPDVPSILTGFLFPFLISAIVLFISSFNLQFLLWSCFWKFILLSTSLILWQVMIYILPWCSLDIPLVIDILHVLLIILLIFGEKKILPVSKYSSSPYFFQIITHLLMLPGICLRKKGVEEGGW